MQPLASAKDKYIKEFSKLTDRPRSEAEYWSLMMLRTLGATCHAPPDTTSLYYGDTYHLVHGAEKTLSLLNYSTCKLVVTLMNYNFTLLKLFNMLTSSPLFAI